MSPGPLWEKDCPDQFSGVGELRVGTVGREVGRRTGALMKGPERGFWGFKRSRLLIAVIGTFLSLSFPVCEMRMTTPALEAA